MKKELLSLVFECIDLEKLVIGLVEDIGEKALKEIVEKSPTKIDDTIVNYILPLYNPVFEKMVKERIAELKEKATT